MIAADWTLPGITYDSASREFAIFSEDISLVGLKTITVQGYYENYSANFFEMTFQIDLVSPCGIPSILQITPPGGIPASTDYFLTDSDVYQLPEFTVNYAICDLTYSFSVTPSLGTDGISFDSDASQREFTYNFSFDMSYIQTYDITATALVT